MEVIIQTEDDTELPRFGQLDGTKVFKKLLSRISQDS